MEPECPLQHSQVPATCPSPHGQQLLAPQPTSKLEDKPLSDDRDFLFNITAATLHIGGRSYIRNLWTRHAVVTGTYLSWTYLIIQPPMSGIF
jgi:hypothetical protein